MNLNGRAVCNKTKRQRLAHGGRWGVGRGPRLEKKTVGGPQPGAGPTDGSPGPRHAPDLSPWSENQCGVWMPRGPFVVDPTERGALAASGISRGPGLPRAAPPPGASWRPWRKGPAPRAGKKNLLAHIQNTSLRNSNPKWSVGIPAGMMAVFESVQAGPPSSLMLLSPSSLRHGIIPVAQNKV